MPSPVEIGTLLLVAVVAGAMNAIAGGGTLLTFPTLLAFGMPAIQANATSTLALLVGIGGSVYGYREHMPTVRAWSRQFGVISVIGGLAGAILLTRTSEETFAQLVPFLVLFATVLFMAQSFFRRLAATESKTVAMKPGHSLLAMVVQFLVALYGGYFGAGIGILMLAVFGLMGLHHIHQMNALKTILGGLINVVAALYFVYSGLIAWPQAMIMTVGATAGYFLGSSLAQRISQQQVRQMITYIGLGISVYMFYRQFLQA